MRACVSVHRVREGGAGGEARSRRACLAHRQQIHAGVIRTCSVRSAICASFSTRRASSSDLRRVAAALLDSAKACSAWIICSSAALCRCTTAHAHKIARRKLSSWLNRPFAWRRKPPFDRAADAGTKHKDARRPGNPFSAQQQRRLAFPPPTAANTRDARQGGRERNHLQVSGATEGGEGGGSLGREERTGRRGRREGTRPHLRIQPVVGLFFLDARTQVFQLVPCFFQQIHGCIVIAGERWIILPPGLCVAVRPLDVITVVVARGTRQVAFFTTAVYCCQTCLLQRLRRGRWVGQVQPRLGRGTLIITSVSLHHADTHETDPPSGA